MNTEKNRGKNELIGALLAISGGVLWGFSGACGQFLFEYKNATSGWLVPYRLITAGVLLLAYFLIKDPKHTLSIWKKGKDRLVLCIYGFIGILLAQLTYFIVIEASNAGTATVIQYTNPAFIILVTCLMTKALPRKSEVIALVCALTGIYLLATHGNPATLALSPKALIIGIISSWAVVVYTMVAKPLMDRFSPVLILAWGMVLGGILLMPIYRPWEYDMKIDMEVIAAFLGVVVLGTMASFSLYMLSVKFIGPAKASLYACVEPVTSLILSSVWLGSVFTYVDIIGAILIVSVVFILFAGNKKDNPTLEE